jgi:hypothetical protein
LSLEKRSHMIFSGALNHVAVQRASAEEK